MADETDEKTRILPGAVPPSDDATVAAPAEPGDDRTAVLSADAGDATAVLPAGAAEEAAPAGTGSAPPAAGAPAVAAGRAGGAAEPPAPGLDDDATVVRVRPRGRPRLLARDARGRVHEHPLAGPETTVGRSEACDLVLANPEVSRTHARLVERDGARVLVAAGTRRNTYVNGELVAGERVLRHGDVIELASERLVYAETDETPPFGGAATARGPRAALAAAAVLAAAGVGALAWSLLARPRPAPPPPPAAVPELVPAPPMAAPAAGEGPGEARVAEPSAEDAPPDVPGGGEDAARLARIDRLLYEGDIAFLEDRLTTPPDGSAVYAYGEVLKLDPANERALAQVAAIIDKYLGWAESARARGDRRRARIFADKAAYVRAQVPAAGDATAIARRLEALGAGAPGAP